MTKGRDHLAERRAELERRLAALTPEQRAQLDRSRGETQPIARPEGVQPRAGGVPVPMSFAQELLWLLDRANPGMHGYNVPRTARLRGALDVAALTRALSDIVARHEVLRSTFDMVDGELRQIVNAPSAVVLSEIDLSGRPKAQREDEAVAKVRELTRRPFDLTKDSQLRSTLIRLADDDHVLLLESHHVASDAWSRNILLRELSALYDAYRTGRDAKLPPVTVQYGDFAIWQRDALRGEKLERLLDYWRGKLRDAPSVLELPTDRPRPVTPSFEGDARSRMLPASLLEKLRELSRANESTLFMTLLAAFDVLLARYTGQGDIVVGSPIAGRANEGTEGIIGYFANTLVLRTQLDDDPTFVELLGRVREVALGAFEHQDVPYEKLVLEIQRDRAMGAGSAPLFQTMFTLQDAELRTMQLPGLAIEPFGSARGATKFDLSLFMHEQTGGLRAAFEFRTDLFDGTTIDRMLAQLEVLLEAIVAEPRARVSSLRMLPPSERETLDRWSSGGMQPLEAETLHEQIALQATRTPDAIAVESEGASPSDPLRRLTFRELDERAAILARYLVGMGVGPDVGVGICIERSPELVTAMLGVLKAGGYYLPLDPEYPQDRLAFMLEDARVPVLLTTDSLRDVVPISVATDAPEIVAVDSQWESVIVARGSDDIKPRTTTGSHLAYVIYTSGSTGRPKGVMIPHTAVVNYLTWMRSEFPLDTRDAVLQKAPASFDACIWEFFLPLVSGARLVLARPGGHQDPAYLLEALVRHDITLLQLVPSQLQMMLETPGADGPVGLPRLRRLFLGGEALPSELLTRLASVCPSLPVTNLYGPTEATVYASHWSVDLTEWRGGAVPIGRPITGATIHLVDALRQPVPIGVPGELCIGGVGLARGYLDRAELTAEKFVSDPFAVRTSAMLYRTGDRARYRADGTLEYLGRIDTQVKLRGFRVELGEIENALVHVDDVQSAVVLVREDTPGDQRLVAYLIAVPGFDHSEHTPASLRQQLKATLPEFMVPTAFVWLSEWPMNANGKLDRKMLPAPDASDAAVVERVAPRTPTEHAVAAIWKEILNRDVGIEDDFFELGGHSLLALRTLARIADQLGPRIPLRVLFDAPTISQLAARIDAASTSVRAGITRRAGDVAPMTHAQELLWVLQSASPDNAAYNVAEQWRITGALDVEALQRAFDALVRRHDVFRTTFGEENGRPTQRIIAPTSFVLERMDFATSEAPDAAAQAHARELARTPFDLSRDPLLRVALLRVATDAHVLVLVTHHIVSDGWSRGVMQRDLSALYSAELRGDAPTIAPLSIRFADFAAWQRESLSGDTLEKHLAYWREHLGGGGIALDLPTDHPRPASPGFEGAKQTVVFPADLLSNLQRIAKANDVTLYMLLLGAFQALLHRYAGQENITVATVVAGRDDAVLEPIVGYFANTLALRTSFADDPTVAELLARARAVVLGASEHAAVPFEMLASARDGEAALPLPNVMFVLQNNAPAALTLGDAQIRSAGVDAGTAKFDLFLSMGEMPTGLRAALQYRTELFDDETATRMLGHLRTLLEGIAHDKTAHVSELPLLTERERTQLLVDWNATDAEFSHTATMHSLVAEQAKATPDKIAVADDAARSYTYAELTRRAGILANVLRAQSVGPGSYVGVCMDRSVEMIVALLAVLESGAAYVPLDPAYPEDRIAFMLDDSQARAVISESRVTNRLPWLRGRAEAHGQIILLDGGWDARLAVQPVPKSDARDASSTDVGYVIYTSGSTGRPKGVMIEHRSAVAFITWAKSVFSSDELANVLASTSICFDLSIFEMFVPLASGGTVVVVADALAIGTAPRDHAITLINSVPSAAAELIRVNAIPSSVRTINLAGEPLAQRLVDQLYDVPTVERVYDLYGPSEDTTYSTFTLRTRGGRANIGRPIANTQVYVLDRRGVPVPVGIPGELFIAGAGLARGYLHRADLTDDRFVPNPFATAHTSSRMYRTGDLVRYLADGRLEYFGRLDHQIKLRGFRIELGEVEAVIAADEAVAQTVAVVCEVAPGDSRLVAYLSPKPGAEVDLARVRAAMRRSLPLYMLPSAIVTMDALPLTQNGKIDRKLLPLPDLSALAETPYVAPRSRTEEVVAAAWCDVLKRDRVGVHDHFFELGGHSLMAMRVVSRVQESFGVRLPLNAVLEWPTVEQLAAKIDERVAAGSVETAEQGITRVSRVASRRATSNARVRNTNNGKDGE
ncbi:MAG: amino acid adenylation domain-containing protein [bacterium]